jgi:hypothetical protein
MVKIIGNSAERVPIRDLGDVIYYRQVKEYTDQEWESSKDLKREHQRGRVVILEKYSTARMSSASGTPSTGVSIQDIKQAFKELKEENGSLRDVMMLLIPAVVDAIKNNMPTTSYAPVQSHQVSNASSFVGPEFVPTISTKDMVSNIEVSSKQVSSDDLANNLAALRKMKSK